MQRLVTDSRSNSAQAAFTPRVESRGAIEIARRLFLLAGLVVAVALFFWTQFEPYVMVSLATPDEIARAEGRPEPEARRPGALLDRRITRKGEGDLLTVSGPEWDQFFAGVSKSFADNYPIAGWEHRIQKRDLDQARKDNERRGRMTATDRAEEQEQIQRLKAKYNIDVTFRGSFRYLYFLAREIPFAAAASPWRPGIRAVLQRAEAPEPKLSAAYLPAYELIGFSDVITLPQAFSSPYRHLAYWPALIGLALYIILPWGRREPDVLAYARWRVILGDLAAGLLMFGLFFALPFAIIGGTVETVTTHLLFALGFWLIAALGLVAVYWTTWSAAYRLAIRTEGLAISALSGSRAISYDAIRTVQPVRIRPPKWLIALMWVAALLGRRPGGVGQALILGASESNGLRLDLADGTRAYVWYSDQMGSTSIPHFERLGQALRRESIHWADTLVEIRAIFPPTR